MVGPCWLSILNTAVSTWPLLCTPVHYRLGTENNKLKFSCLCSRPGTVLGTWACLLQENPPLQKCPRKTTTMVMARRRPGARTAYGFFGKVKVTQLSPTLCDPMDYTIHGLLQVGIVEWVAFPFSRGSSQPRDQIQISRIAGRFFTS